MDYPEIFYHVLSRGNEKREIFRDKSDYLKFLDTIGQMVQRFKLGVHAYVLMKNHYHLLIHTKEANLSRAIQWLGVCYSVWFNRRHQRTGHLFQGRFKSFLIENERYFTAMVLYIHGNPLRAGLVGRLEDYPWSSYPAYVDKRHLPSWLTTDLVLAMYGGSRKKFRREQQQFLERKENILKDLRHGLYLGREEFSEECIERAKKEEHREKPQLRLLLRGRDIEMLALAILKRLGEKDPSSVLKARRRYFANRDVAITILYQLGIYRNEEIGRVFGVGYTAIPGAVKRGREYIRSNERLGKMVSKLLNDI
ncbi:MAG: transposase [Deltaproteobacteria bacterium]|nr:transposase [Deltaproteobacteria bacterium]